MVNLDPVFHDIQGYETSKLEPGFSSTLPLPMSKKLRKEALLAGKEIKDRAGKVITQRIKMGKQRNLFVMQCGFHAYMESWGFAVKNPYYALSAQDGSYAISDIPPGTYKVQIWHPMVNEDYTVTIAPNGTTELPIEIDAPKGRLYANEVSEGTRFGVELLGDVTINPIVERQTY